MQVFKNFNGKKVLITGHTGFKGSWLSIWLKQLGASVYGASLNIPSEPSHFISADLSSDIEDYRFDIRDAKSISALVQKIQPDFVFHLAAQALVRASYESPLETISTNSMGTANLLDALKELDKSVVAVMITSDKAYDNLEWAWGYRETDRLGGKDPYSASKGMAELVIRSYVESFFNSENSNVAVGIARAGNVIGGGDWAADRIVPDCMKAWSLGQIVDIRNPQATRPWQHVLEPISGYLTLGSALSKSKQFHGEAYNFGPSSNQNYPVSELIDEMAKYWKQVRWNNISKSEVHPYEAGLLKLNCDKALHELSWQPTLKFEETVRMTIEWYKAYYQKNAEKSISETTISQISEYTELAKSRSVLWGK
jgi:CDP-glucose 4,6-dehydratase